MTAYTYVDSVNPNLICCICHAPFVKPTTTRSCCHTFCKECITQALETASQCPIDRSGLNIDDLLPASPIVRHLVDELMVECPQRSHGCSHACQRQWLSTHVKDECQFVQVSCCEEQCDAMILRRDARKHSVTCEHRLVQCEACDVRVRFVDLQVHRDQCPVEEVTCPHCSLILPRGDMSSHVEVCPRFVVECAHAAHGCPWTGPRFELAPSHLERCTYESIKGFFSLHSSRLSALEAENEHLRGRVVELENALSSTKRDMHAAQQALGPWFRLDGCQSPSRPPPPSEPAPRPYQRRRLSNALNSAMFGYPAEASSSVETSAMHPGLPSHGPVTSVPPDSLLQYFPPPDESPTLPTISVTSESLSSPNDINYPRCAPNSSVAPINLNTTLEGSLTSLRSSIVTLAATLDSESRRHDVSLTTETLRVNEEVGCLRAIVHGLRMQVHQIMMDRNSQVAGGQSDAGSVYFPDGRAGNIEPWTSSVSSVRYLNHHPPIHRPISIGHTTTTHVQSTKL